jgi:predicted amidophosphoribosyltransferase
VPSASLTVEEASDAYANAMRNPAALRPGVCPICRTFHNPQFGQCVACSQQPNLLDAVAPITYSVDSGQMHAALRGYKDDPHAQVRRFHAVRLTAILWRFLEGHEPCVAAAAGVDQFDLVTTVPSKSSDRDEERNQLRLIVGQWCEPTADRWRRVLRPAEPPILGRPFAERRYLADSGVAKKTVLLIDDTWTTGSSMQSAAAALREAGAQTVAAVVIGRHLRLDFAWEGGSTLTEYKKLPRAFDWGTCPVHITGRVSYQ